MFELAAPADRFDRLLLELGELQAAGKHVVVVNDEETCNKLFISLLKVLSGPHSPTQPASRHHPH